MSNVLTPKLKAAMEAEDGEAILEALSEKQRNFCYEFLKDLNATRAIIRAGYNTNNAAKMGTQLKNHPGVKAALVYLQKDRSEKLNVDAAFVLNKIIKSIDRAEQKGNEAAVLRGAELLARHLGMFVDRQEISGPEGSEIAVNQQKIEEDVRDFTSAISRLARRAGTGEVSQPVDSGSDSEA